jgi:hypothetical protein
MSFTPRPLYRDFVGMLALALFSLTIGMGVNCIRRTPIPIAYETPAERLDSSVASIGQHTVTFAGWNKDVELPEMRQNKPRPLRGDTGCTSKTVLQAKSYPVGALSSARRI